MNEELKEIIKKDKLADHRGDKKYHLFAGGYEKKLELFKIYLRKADSIIENMDYLGLLVSIMM